MAQFPLGGFLGFFAGKEKGCSTGPEKCNIPGANIITEVFNNSFEKKRAREGNPDSEPQPLKWDALLNT